MDFISYTNLAMPFLVPKSLFVCGAKESLRWKQSQRHTAYTEKQDSAASHA